MEKQIIWKRSTKDTKGFRSNSPWFWVIEVLGDGASGGATAWLLWDRSTLKGWQVGMITFGVVVIIPFIIYFLIFIYNLLRSPSRIRNDYEGEIAKQLIGLNVVSLERWENINQAIVWQQSPLEVSTSLFTYNVKSKIQLNIEGMKEWNYIKKRLSKTTLLKDLENWKVLISEDLIMRKKLLDVISSRVRTKENKLDIPIIDGSNSSASKKPYLTYRYIALLYDTVLSQTIGLHLPDVNKADLVSNSVNKDIVCFQHDGMPIFESANVEERNNAINLFLNYQTALTELSEAKLAREAYYRAKIATDKLKGEFVAILAKSKK